MFSGHTHGGQVVVPFFGPPMPGSAHGKKYSGGLVREDGKMAHVTRGVGTSSLPVRFCCPPEITLATLVKEKPQT